MSRMRSPVGALLAAMLMFACSSEDSDGSSEDPDDGPEPVTFAADIHPILQMKCSGAGSGCHAVDQAPIQPGHAAADVDAAYEATQEVGTTGAPIYERILARVTNEAAMMPPDYANPPCSGMIGAPGCLSEAELELIEAWIAQGTPR